MQKFFKGAQKCPLGIFLLCEWRRHDYPRVGQGACVPGNILQNYTQKHAILVLSETTVKVIFV